jgi:hypothetical protein
MQGKHGGLRSSVFDPSWAACSAPLRRSLHGPEGAPYPGCRCGSRPQWAGVGHAHRWAPVCSTSRTTPHPGRNGAPPVRSSVVILQDEAASADQLAGTTVRVATWGDQVVACYRLSAFQIEAQVIPRGGSVARPPVPRSRLSSRCGNECQHRAVGAALLWHAIGVADRAASSLGVRVGHEVGERPTGFGSQLGFRPSRATLNGYARAAGHGEPDRGAAHADRSTVDEDRAGSSDAELVSARAVSTLVGSAPALAEVKRPRIGA